MTIIACARIDNRIAIAADSRINAGAVKLTINEGKLLNFWTNGGLCLRSDGPTGPIAIGLAGWAVMEEVIIGYMQQHPLPHGEGTDALQFRQLLPGWLQGLWHLAEAKYGAIRERGADHIGPFGETEFSIIIGCQYGLFYIDSTLHTVHIEKYWAIGSGQEFALGAGYVYTQMVEMTAEISGTVPLSLSILLQSIPLIC